MKTKVWWRSRTLWLNAVGGVALVAQSQSGFVIDPETQAALLAVGNLLLRLITNEPIGFESESGSGPFPGVDAGGPGAMP